MTRVQLRATDGSLGGVDWPGFFDREVADKSPTIRILAASSVFALLRSKRHQRQDIELPGAAFRSKIDATGIVAAGSRQQPLVVPISHKPSRSRPRTRKGGFD